MKIDSEIAKIRKYFRQQPEVAVAYLYGSFAREEAKKDSDVDLGILFAQKKQEEKPFSLPQLVFADELGKILKKKVEIQDLDACRVDFSHRVLNEGKLVYCSNEKKRVEFEERILRIFFDLKPAFDQYYRHLSQMAKKGELDVRYL